jgi:hypothetical protein
MSNFRRIYSFALVFLIISLTASAAETSQSTSDPAAHHFMSDELVKLIIEIPKRCMFGDFDAIRQDMMYSDRSKRSALILSLQTLDGTREYSSEILSEIGTSGTRDEPKKIMDEILQTGYPVDIRIKSLEAPQLFALVICKDSSGRKTCARESEEAFRDISQILSDYRNPTSGYTSQDSVYFYQILAIGPDGVSLSDNSLSDTQKLNAFASQVGISAPGSEAAISRLNTLKSYPLEPKDDRVRIQLPVFDPVKCGQ